MLNIHGAVSSLIHEQERGCRITMRTGQGAFYAEAFFSAEQLCMLDRDRDSTLHSEGMSLAFDPLSSAFFVEMGNMRALITRFEFDRWTHPEGAVEARRARRKTD